MKRRNFIQQSSAASAFVGLGGLSSLGFSEAPKGKKFFKSGEKNQWIKRLNNKQISDLENKFKTVMDKFNYI